MSISVNEKLRIPATRIFAVLLAALVILSEGKWEDGLVSVILFACGCFLVAIASLGRVWCSLFIAGYKTDVVISDGPYSMCRHPLYFFSFLGAVGVGLATETLLVPAIILIGFFLYYPQTIRQEEAMLIDRHGSAYLKYKETTPAFFPNPKLFREPETYQVYPRIFRRHAFDTLWFIWLVGIIEIIEALHNMGILPVFFKII